MKKHLALFLAAVMALLLVSSPALAYEDPSGVIYDKPIPEEIYALMPKGDGGIYGGLNDDPAFGLIYMHALSMVDRGEFGNTFYWVQIAGIDLSSVENYLKPILTAHWKEESDSYETSREEFIDSFTPENSENVRSWLLTRRGGYGSVRAGHTDDSTFAEGQLTYMIEGTLLVMISVSNAKSGEEVTSFIDSVIDAVDISFFGYLNDVPGYTKPLNPPLPKPTTATAIPSPQKVLVNGKETAFDAYNINGNNYFKLRDLACVLSGTENQFEVGWDGENNAISLTSDKPYTIVGGEMSAKGEGNKTANPTTSKIYLDGAEISLTAYNILDNNYFKLRDIGQVFDFGVTWDAVNNTIVIDTSIGYTPE